jgi:hypothetical protein
MRLMEGIQSKGRRSGGLAAVLATLLLAMLIAPGASGARVTGGWLPDPAIYCYYSVPSSSIARSYAGIYANPYYNSVRTNCRDRLTRNGIYWYTARPVDWNTTCRWTYNTNNASAYSRSGRVYCWLW